MRDKTEIANATYIDDISGLKLDTSKPYTMQEIYLYEAKNITKATLKYLSATPNKKLAPFSYEWFMILHRDMFGAEHSQIKKEIEYEGIREHLEMALTEGELKELEIRQKKKIVQKEHNYGYDREKTFEEYFGNLKNREERNSAIMEALDDGYGQAEVARYLNITASAVAKVRKKFE